MVVGHGIDVVEIPRLAELLRQHGQRFVQRVFTPAERAYCLGKKRELEHLAGRFAAKEAVAKALGRSLGWRDVAVQNNELGKPTVVLSGRAREAAEGGSIYLSISHSRDYAVAQAVFWVPEPGQEGLPYADE